MNENWYALCVAIVKNVLPEQAFVLLEGQSVYKTIWGKSNTTDMLRMRQQGMTYNAIGEIYGISGSAVCKRISYINKKDRPTAMKTAMSLRTV